MEDMNLLIEANKDLDDLVAGTNLLNDENTIAESLPLNSLDENSSSNNPLLVENLNLNKEDDDDENDEKENRQLDEEDPSTNNKENLHVDAQGLQGEAVEFQAQINKPCQFALARIKTIMKLDPDLNLMSKESVFLIAKATEFFVDFLSKETYKNTCQGSRKTVQKKDIDQAINSIDSLCFLDAALD
jgi:DNA polymerase epsilon subunit 4